MPQIISTIKDDLKAVSQLTIFVQTPCILHVLSFFTKTFFSTPIIILYSHNFDKITPTKTSLIIYWEYIGFKIVL